MVKLPFMVIHYTTTHLSTRENMGDKLLAKPAEADYIAGPGGGLCPVYPSHKTCSQIFFILAPGQMAVYSIKMFTLPSSHSMMRMAEQSKRERARGVGGKR